MKSAFPGFSSDALTFLRNLKRNNRREWFQPRKEQYETFIKLPMLELVGQLNTAFSSFAPSYVTDPQKSVFRIYRDTRFSNDKTPYKTHIAAIFPRNGAERMRGACFYFHFTEKELLAFGGVYQPESDELVAYRALLGDHHKELEEILGDKKLRRTVGRLQGEQMSRTPKGYTPDHPAESLLRHRQWYLESVLDVKVITTKRLLPVLADSFKVMAPFVEFMNRPFARKQKPAKMMFLGF